MMHALNTVYVDEEVALPFSRMRDGKPTPYTLQTIKTREGDDHHIVIGIRPA